VKGSLSWLDADRAQHQSVLDHPSYDVLYNRPFGVGAPLDLLR
jgi:hypothetical protein